MFSNYLRAHQCPHRRIISAVLLYGSIYRMVPYVPVLRVLKIRYVNDPTASRTTVDHATVPVVLAAHAHRSSTVVLATAPKHMSLQCHCTCSLPVRASIFFLCMKIGFDRSHRRMKIWYTKIFTHSFVYKSTQKISVMLGSSLGTILM